jgi:hypothetical protein
MTENYPIFKVYPTKELALEFTELLDKNGIHSVVGDNIPPVDVTFSGSTLEHRYEIRIKQSDFQKAEKILESHAKNLLDEVDSDYYLFEFTNEELYEVLIKADEWNEFDYTLAQKILNDRGKPIDEELLSTFKKERLKTLSEPEGNQKPWLYAGYIFALLGGIIGIIIGYFLWTSKKTLPDGNKVYAYSSEDRVKGKTLFFFATIIMVAWIVFRIVFVFY